MAFDVSRVLTPRWTTALWRRQALDAATATRAAATQWTAGACVGFRLTSFLAAIALAFALALVGATALLVAIGFLAAVAFLTLAVFATAAFLEGLPRALAWAGLSPVGALRIFFANRGRRSSATRKKLTSRSPRRWPPPLTTTLFFD